MRLYAMVLVLAFLATGAVAGTAIGTALARALEVLPV